MGSLSPLDPTSFSRPELVKVSNIDLHLTVNFKNQKFLGYVDLLVDRLDSKTSELILDSLDLNISKVTETAFKQDLEYSLTEKVRDLGSKLTVNLPQTSINSYKIRIEYETSSNASGLQWLAAEQTAGKKHPYLFSQFQAIHARSFLPCQDTPYVKSKYSATIAAPADLAVVMSAVRCGEEIKNDLKECKFKQEVPVPAYLIAIAIGALECRSVGPRSHVWAEKETIDAAAYEFAETESHLKVAEEICGSYEWGIYDLLVLPPSFPFGGMENPCLTFVTPTLLAGDRSLANVVSHEIAHSWSGNLVTQRNFEHFWLNEGFTVFVERKILGKLYGDEFREFASSGGLLILKETVDLLGKDSPLTKLVIDLKGVHPDDAFSAIPYEKGSLFLRYLEDLVGGPTVFDPFLRLYFHHFKNKSIDTEDFKTFFLKAFPSAKVDWNTWLYGTGMPPVILKFENKLSDVCDKFKEALLKWKSTSDPIPIKNEDITQIRTGQVIRLLQYLVDSEAFTVDQLKQIQGVCKFDSSKNAEIKFRWLRICLKAHWEDKIPVVLDWLNEVGRMKYVRPLYRDLYEWEGARQKAIENFEANKKYMMHVVSYTVAKDLRLN